MSLKERELAILEYLKERKEASVTELCGALFVSEPTVRRDLAALNASGKIIRTHGGAVYRREPGENLPQTIRERENLDAKAAIGKKSLSLIKDGDVIMVDASSTALALLSLLDPKLSVVVITNSAKAPQLLTDTNVKTFVTGGELASHSLAYIGGYAEDFIRSFNADLCFFSVRTLTADGRLTDNAIAENSLRRVMMSRSKRSVLLLDSKKIGEPCLNTLCDLDAISQVVSERDLSSLYPLYSHKFI